MSEKPQIVIATPVYGTPHTASVSVGYHMTVCSLLRDPVFTALPAVHMCDLVRGRSRLVRQFLEETPGTHLLFWDEDVVCPGGAEQAGRLIARMVETGHPFIGCTYRKKVVNVDAVRALDDAPGSQRDSDMLQHLEEYAYRATKQAECINGCVEVDAIPLGFALAQRGMLEHMTRAYNGGPHGLAFDDEVGDEKKQTLALFQLMIRDGGLLGEDYSFCQRYRDIGGKVQLWAGPDCELDHVGSYVFKGSRGGYVHAK